MEHPVEGCLGLIACLLKNNFAKSHLICFDSVMEQPAGGYLHSAVCSLENNFVSSHFYLLALAVHLHCYLLYYVGCCLNWCLMGSLRYPQLSLLCSHLHDSVGLVHFVLGLFHLSFQLIVVSGVEYFLLFSVLC